MSFERTNPGRLARVSLFQACSIFFARSVPSLPDPRPGDHVSTRNHATWVNLMMALMNRHDYAPDSSGGEMLPGHLPLLADSWSRISPNPVAAS
jgi:hypothetical protein